jgi:glutamate carboxypeptidase
VNVGLFHGGTAKNTVPEHASLQLDARFEQFADAASLTSRLRQLVAQPYAGLVGIHEKLHSVRFALEGGITRPPMEASEASQALRQRCLACPLQPCGSGSHRPPIGCKRLLGGSS